MMTLSQCHIRGIRILFRGGCIRKISDSKYTVRSRAHSDWYAVRWREEKWRCECAYFRKNRGPCEHIYSVLYLLRLPTILLLNTNYEAFICPRCGAEPDKTTSKGGRDNKTGRVQIFKCKNCGHKFSSTLGFSKPRHDPLLITAAIDLYMKNLSFRQVQQHLEMIYGCEVTPMTVHNWVKRYTKLVTNYVENLRPNVGGEWHADEMVVKIKQSHAYLWNVLDRKTRFLLVSTLTKGRGVKEATRILREAVGSAGKKPGRLVTDALKSYNKAVGSLKVRQHISGPKFSNPSNNNLIERLHGTLRTRYDGLRALGGVRSGATLADGILFNYNFIRPHLGLDGSTPAEAAGIRVKSRNKWHYFITAAKRHKNRKALCRQGNRRTNTSLHSQRC
jgi:transposase-like protein